MSADYLGKPVTEAEAATGLGFANVDGMRRWQTALGTENANLKYALSQAESDADRFRSAGMRGTAILERCKSFLTEIKIAIDAGDTRQLKEAVGWYDDEEPLHLKKLLLAIGVVCGSGVDWDHELRDWLDYLDPLYIKIKDDQCTVRGILDGSERSKKECERTLAKFTGPKLTVTADHVGLVGGGCATWLASVPKTCRICYKMSQLGQNIYYNFENPYEVADFENPEEWGLEPPPKPARNTCLVQPPDMCERGMPEPPDEEPEDTCGS